jgi:hypothetical protein
MHALDTNLYENLNMLEISTECQNEKNLEKLFTCVLLYEGTVA